MTDLVNQPEGTSTVRKVQMSALWAAISTPLAYMLAAVIVSYFPFWQGEGYHALAVAVEVILTGIFTGMASWYAGWLTQSRAGEV